MKSIKLYIYAIILFTTLLNCKKSRLDFKNENKFSFESYFTTPQTILEATNATYLTLLNPGMFCREYYYIFDMLGFDIKKGPSLLGDLESLSIYTFDGRNVQINQLWAAMYRMVYRANLTINRGNNLMPQLTDVQQADVKRYIAEARFLKAYANFHLVFLWGDVPLRKDFESYNESFPARTPSTEIWAEVEKDLTEAIPDLPLSYNADNLGRATKGAAIALLGKVYLYQKKWQQAQQTLEQLTKAPYSYELATDYDELFDETNHNTKETIFMSMNRPWDTPALQSDGNAWGSVFGGMEIWGRATPSIRANEYDFNGWFNTYFTFAAAKAFKYDLEGVSGYKDPRGKLTYYGDSLDLPGATTYMEKTATPKPYDYNDTRSKGKIRYQLRKYGLNTRYEAVPFMKGVNAQIIRYADVLLMIAEAYIQQGNTGSVPLEYINKVRTRVGAANYTSLGGQAMAIIERERRLELTGEQSRYFDLVRWGKLVETVNDEKKAEGQAPNVQAKHVLLPIPACETDYNPTVRGQVKDSWN